jgi:lysophospholipase L1-like esterase
MASDLAHSYPAVLQQALSLELADAHVAVINRGIGGQDAREELARMAADVLAIRPQVVIWQVGANGALRNSDPGLFRERVTTGVHILQAAGVDVVLMDNQQSPRLLARPEEPVMDAELARVADDTGAALFSRRSLMQAWGQAGAAPAQFIATDGLHHNDRGYHCVATALARSIIAGLAADRPLTASR